MNNDSNASRDDSLEIFLDGLIEKGDDGAARNLHGVDAERRRQIDLQARIDERLTELFQAEASAPALMARRLTGDERPTFSTSVHQGRVIRRQLGWAAAAVAAAASIIWLALRLPMERRDAEPLFVARPLADLYRETIAEGFEPYYECREPERFADTFRRRQGLPLALAPLPDGTSMLGLSYPGGLSRNATAMLCRVDGEPVMVFVDRAEADNPIASQHAGEEAQVFRQERYGLVFYEVTPFDRPRMADYLVPATP